MSRLFLMLAVGVFLALPPLFATGADPQDDQDNSWKSLYSVVSHRGVKVNLVQPPPAPAPDAVPEDTATDEAAAPEPATPETPAAETSEPDVAAPELSEPEAPAADTDAIEAPAVQEAESPGDEPAPQPVLTPESCGPVRARISDFGQPDAVPVPDDVSPMPQSPPAQTSSAFASDAPCATSVCSSGCGHSGCGLRGRRNGGGSAVTGENPRCPCQMPQHYSYYPEMHGYYYFRPYNWTHIREHQRITSEWGEDPRNPYGTQLFEQVYADYRAEKEGEAGPLLETEDAEVPLPPEGN